MGSSIFNYIQLYIRPVFIKWIKPHHTQWRLDAFINGLVSGSAEQFSGYPLPKALRLKCMVSGLGPLSFSKLIHLILN